MPESVVLMMVLVLVLVRVNADVYVDAVVIVVMLLFSRCVHGKHRLRICVGKCTLPVCALNLM